MKTATKKKSDKRSLAHDITLEEAIEVLKLGGEYEPDKSYKLDDEDVVRKVGRNQLYYTNYPFGLVLPETVICVNFSNTKNPVKLLKGKQDPDTYSKIKKYLQEQGFDLTKFKTKK